MDAHSNHLLSLQAPKRFMWTLMMTVSSPWSSSAPRWMRTLSLFGPRTTRPSQIVPVWLLSAKRASKCYTCHSTRTTSHSPLSSHPVVPMCPRLQNQSHLQQPLPGGSGHLLLCGHQHWRHLLQLHTHRGGWVSQQSWHLWPCAPETWFAGYFSEWRKCWRCESLSC